MTNNDLQHLHAQKRLTLAISSTIAGTRGPLSVNQALKRYPVEFAILLDEMTRAAHEAEVKQLGLFEVER